MKMPACGFVALVVSTLGGFAFGQGKGATPASQPQSQPAANSLKAFGELPARFNGRITTYDAVARSLLAQVSNRETFFDGQGREQPAIRWMLDILTSQDESDRVIPIDDSALIALLKLPEHTEPSSRHLFTIGELRAGYEAFRAEGMRVGNIPDEKRTNYDRHVLDLSRRLRSLIDILRFNVKANNAAPAWSMDSEPVTLLIAPVMPGGPWRTMERDADPANPVVATTDPFYTGFVNLLVNDLQHDVTAFDHNVSKLKEKLVADGYIKNGIPVSGPFQFNVPAGWVEIGAPGRPGVPYGDTRAFGMLVTRLLRFDGEQTARIDVNHFAGPTATLAEMANTWRVTQGLVPLGPNVLDTFSSLIGKDRRYPVVDVTTPAGLNNHRARSISVVIQRDDHTWVVSLDGPLDLVAREKETFAKFVQSLTFGSADALSKWLPLPPGRPEITGGRMLAAVVTDGPYLLCVTLAGLSDATARQRESFEAFVKSVSVMRHTAMLPTLHWKLPENWIAASPASGMDGSGNAVIYTGANQPDGLMVSVDLLVADETGKSPHAAENAARLDLWNYWRGTMAMEPWPNEAAVGPATRPVHRDDGKTAILLEIAHPPATRPATFPATRPVETDIAILYEMPGRWSPVQVTSPLQYGRLQLKDGERTADITMMNIPGDGGGEIANVNRWRSQLGLVPATEKEVRQALHEVTINGLKGKQIELVNEQSTPPRRIVALILPRQDRTWFIKMMGPADLVQRESEVFDTLIKSIRFKEMPRQPQVPGN